MARGDFQAVYAPTIAYATGVGALVPIIPVLAVGRGASIQAAAVIAGLLLVGEVVASVPAYWVVKRLGEPAAMLCAGLVGSVSLGVMSAFHDLLTLIVSVSLVGVASSLLGLARHSYLAMNVPIAKRARALSLLAGTIRGGAFLGPLMTASILYFDHSILMCLIAASILMLAAGLSAFMAGRQRHAVVGSVPHAHNSTEGASGSNERLRALLDMPTTFKRKAVLLAVGASSLSLLRAGRQVILPVWALLIGVQTDQLALILAISSGFELSLFYVSGVLMDRFGRGVVAVPSTAALAVGYLALVVIPVNSNPVLILGIVALVLALANSLAGGVNMTIGADLAPIGQERPFLAVWRFVGDAGKGVAPFVIGGLVNGSSVQLAGLAFFVVGSLGALSTFRGLREFT